MKNILIIGGTGTISSPITNKLAHDLEVKLTLMNRGHKNDQLPDNIEVLIADFNNKKQVEKVLTNRHFDTVINFIVYHPEQAKQEIEIYQNRTKQYIFISTVASLNHDITCNISEETPQGNLYSEYGRNKQACEEVFLAAYHAQNFPITIIRPSQTYSQNRLPLSVKGKSYWGVIQRMIDGKEVIVHGDGQSLWASTHANDFCEMFMPVVANKKCVGEIYQVMNNQPHTWDMVYRKLASQLQVEYKPVYISANILKKSIKYDLLTNIRGDKHYSNIYNTNKIQSLNQGYTCKVSLEDGIKEFIEYHHQHPELMVADAEFDLWCDNVIERYKEATNNLMDNL